MRLINVKTRKLEEFIPDEAPPYAILSHRWEDNEVTFAELVNQSPSIWADGAYFKFQRSCQQALDDGLGFVWIDTCCIDKSSSAELSEAINSMFSWYKNSKVCYAFLNDVSSGDLNDESSPCQDTFCKSKWFTRGWTLQELLAPTVVRFYSGDWMHIGDKASSVRLIHKITGIYDAFITNADLRGASIAERMSWASKRNVTRKEDTAYSLLGIFSIKMPLLYGEGETKAFLRLQEELMKSDTDESLFAWYVPQVLWHEEEKKAQYLRGSGAMGLLATSPRFFEACEQITQANYGGLPSFQMVNGKIQMDTLVEKSADHSNGGVFFIYLRCRMRYDFENILAIPLALENGIYYRIRGQPKPLKMNFWKRGYIRTMRVLLSTHDTEGIMNDTGAPFILRSLPCGYTVAAVLPPEAAGNDLRTHIISTGLTWQNLWDDHYDGKHIWRYVLLKPVSPHNRTALVVSLQISAGSPYWIPQPMKVETLLEEIGLHESFTEFIATKNGNGMSKPVYHPRRLKPQKAAVPSPSQRYVASVAIEELICGPALVVDVCNTTDRATNGRYSNQRTKTMLWLSVLVIITWFLDKIHAISSYLPSFGTTDPKQLSMSGLIICWYSIVQFLWTIHGSLATSFSVRKTRKYLAPFSTIHVDCFICIYLKMFINLCIGIWEPSMQRSQWALWFNLFSIVVLVSLKIPSSLVVRPTRYWRH